GEKGFDQIDDRGGKFDLAYIAATPTLSAPFYDLLFEQQPGDLDQIERISFRLAGKPVEHRFRDVYVAEHKPEHRAYLVFVERGEFDLIAIADAAHLSKPCAHGIVLGRYFALAQSADDEYALARRGAHQIREKFEHQFVGPLQVVEKEHNGPQPRKADVDACEIVEDAIFLLLRRAAEGHVSGEQQRERIGFREIADDAIRKRSEYLVEFLRRVLDQIMDRAAKRITIDFVRDRPS